MTKKVDKDNYKSHRGLGIPKKLYESLIWFVNSVDNGNINGGKKKFLMETVVEDNYNECGTAACIGGWCAIKTLGIEPDKKGRFDLSENEEDINDLFNKWCGHIEIHKLFNAHGYVLSDVNASTARNVTENYLKTGKVNYDRYM